MPYTPHTKLKINNPDLTKIWRYINFEQFQNMIENSSLFFCRADKLGEKWEGSLTKKMIEKFDMEGKKILSSDGKEYTLKEWHKFKELKSHLISCWHENNDESYEMWMTYAPDNNNINNKALAIQSTISSLKNSFHIAKEKIWIDEVKYIDYDTLETKNRILNINYPNTLELFFFKRREFKQEQELRAIINLAFSKHKSEVGINIKCDLNILIEKIVLSPNSDEVLLNNIKKILNRFRYKFKIINSELSREPYI